MELPSPMETVAALEKALERHPEYCDALIDGNIFGHVFTAQIGRCLRNYQIDYLIDVGANAGQYSTSMIGYTGYRGRLVAFEPIRKFYESLASNLAYWNGNNGLEATAVHAAVGEHPGEALINIGMGHGGTSSLLHQTENLVQLAGDASFDGKTETVPVVRIDEYFADLDFSAHKVMLKMDVQGFEGSVLRSCGRMLKNFTLIQSEFSAIPFYRGQILAGELFTFMQDNGFSPICIQNNFGNVPKGVYYDFDVIFARTDQVAQ